MKILAERLRTARASKGLSQTEVMKLTKINNKTLSGYENEVSEPDYETLLSLAALYGITTDYLLGKVNDPHGKIKQLANVQNYKMVAMEGKVDAVTYNGEPHVDAGDDPRYDVGPEWADIVPVLRRAGKIATPEERKRIARIIKASLPELDEEDRE